MTALVILSRGNCGLSRCITRYLVAMAVADLLVVLVAIIIQQINFIYLFAYFLFKSPLCAVILVLQLVTSHCSVWFTVAFTFDRYVAICCEKLRKQYCTDRTATVVLATAAAGGVAVSVPWFFAVDPRRCVPTAEYMTSPAWASYEFFLIIINPLSPIGLIMLFNALTVRYINAANRVRRELRCNGHSPKDPEVEKRRKSMILLFALSTNFILLWIPHVVHSTKWQKENYFYTDKYFSTPIYILQQFGFMLRMLSICTNTCIYALTQRRFREQLKSGLKYLITLTGQIYK
ncbi:probable G-protein coupled receptor 139 [Narcine bancroftii]|uniref:probable G-protein coupled receptor 139 n=1 Tax=Narcine bancroftii TaxID=1343680 RepID=UPI003831DF62